MEQGTHIPVDVLNANMRKLGRSFDDTTELDQGWQGDEYGLYCTWADGFTAFVGFGTVASAIFDGYRRTKH